MHNPVSSLVFDKQIVLNFGVQYILKLKQQFSDKRRQHNPIPIRQPIFSIVKKISLKEKTPKCVQFAECDCNVYFEDDKFKKRLELCLNRILSGHESCNHLESPQSPYTTTSDRQQAKETYC